jgi:DNA-3-methyladenine glycosylase II
LAEVNQLPNVKRVSPRVAVKKVVPKGAGRKTQTESAIFDHDLAIEHLKKRDRHLKKLIEKVGPFTSRPDLELSSFEHLLKAIVYQQLTGKAAATIYGRVRALLDLQKPVPKQVVALPDSSLRAAGLSGSKVSYLKDLAAKALAGEVPSNVEMEEMTDEEIIEKLTAIKGIGRWSVEMLLIFHLGRLDVLPVADYGVRKGFAYLYGHEELPTPKALTLFAEVWKPYRSIGSWYMWRAAELMKPASGSAKKAKKAKPEATKAKATKTKTTTAKTTKAKTVKAKSAAKKPSKKVAPAKSIKRKPVSKSKVKAKRTK